MKIIKLQAENIKKLKAVEITPSSNLVKITGKNAQGKTSVLDSILYALAGKKAIPSKPIREGEDHANIEMDLGDFKIVRTFTEKDTYLKVTTKEGAEYPKAQEKLSTLVENISFDPLEFANKNDREQVEVLTNLLGIGTKLKEIDSEYEELYQERTFANRRVKELTAKAKVEKPDDKYFTMEKIDVSKVSEQLEEERDKYKVIEGCNANMEEIKQEIAKMEKELERLMKLKADTEKDFDVKTGQELKEKLETATETNSLIDKASEYKELELEKISSVEDYEKLNVSINENRATREKLIAESKMPIEGLNISDGKVLYNEIPFDQLSGAERLRVSLSIAMAMNPELRVIRILDGSLLDVDNLKVIEEMADDEDFQVWIEIVDDSGEVGFYIEEGEVKELPKLSNKNK